LGVELDSLLPDDKKEMKKKLPASLSAAGQMFGKHNEKRLLRHALGFANPAKKRNC